MVIASASRRIMGAATITTGPSSSHDNSQLFSQLASSASGDVDDAVATKAAMADVSPDCSTANTKWL